MPRECNKSESHTIVYVKKYTLSVLPYTRGVQNLLTRSIAQYVFMYVFNLA